MSLDELKKKVKRFEKKTGFDKTSAKKLINMMLEELTFSNPILITKKLLTMNLWIY